jgi:hypothetical protein
MDINEIGMSVSENHGSVVVVMVTAQTIVTVIPATVSGLEH